MHWSYRFSLTVSLVVASIASTQALEPQPQPQPQHATKTDIASRRHAIQQELDGNHDTVKGLYQLMDATPEQDVDAKSFLETQILQFDARSDILFQELDALDKHEYQQQRKRELGVQADRLHSEAAQLRKLNLLIPAATREAKAKALRKALADGSWKLLVEEEWSCDEQPSHLATSIQLAVEVETLKNEMASLRKEVQQLRQLIEKLTHGKVRPAKSPE